MGVLDLTSAIDRVRLMVGDHLDLEIFPDDVYEYLLDKHNDSENAAAREAAYLILGTLSQTSGRQRLDRLEIHNDAFQNYLVFLQEFVKNPSGALSPLAGIYAAGITKADVLANEADSTILQKRIPVALDVEQHSEEWFEGEYGTTSAPTF